MEDKLLFGKRMVAVRESLGLSRRDVANKSGYRYQYLGEIERGVKWASLERVLRIARSIGVSPAAFFEFDSEEVDPAILRTKLQSALATQNLDQLQQSYRVMNALIPIHTDIKENTTPAPRKVVHTAPKQK